MPWKESRDRVSRFLPLGVCGASSIDIQPKGTCGGEDLELAIKHVSRSSTSKANTLIVRLDLKPNERWTADRLA